MTKKTKERSKEEKKVEESEKSGKKEVSEGSNKKTSKKVSGVKEKTGEKKPAREEAPEQTAPGITKEDKKDNISRKLVEEVKKGIIEEKKPSLQATPKKSEFVAVVHVHASKNNTIVTVTDLSGSETLGRASGGMVSKTGREEKSPFAGGQIAKRLATILKDNGVQKVDVLLRGKGGHSGQKSPGRAASTVIKILARSGIRIRRIEDVTPIAHGGCKPPGGKRGRRV